jgi:hypothetical protein
MKISVNDLIAKGSSKEKNLLPSSPPSAQLQILILIEENALLLHKLRTVQPLNHPLNLSVFPLKPKRVNILLFVSTPCNHSIRFSRRKQHDLLRLFVFNNVGYIQLPVCETRNYGAAKESAVGLIVHCKLRKACYEMKVSSREAGAEGMGSTRLHFGDAVGCSDVHYVVDRPAFVGGCYIQCCLPRADVELVEAIIKAYSVEGN